MPTDPHYIRPPRPRPPRYCGSGYNYVGKHKMSLNGKSYNPARGYVYVYWNGAKGKNCLVAQPQSSWAGFTSKVGVWARDYRADPEDGVSDGYGYTNYRYYAGPIYLSAPTCIALGGNFDYKGSHYSAYVPKAHCG
ncbi:hypothetical protein ACFW9F_25420 [Streptomyces sp. NPDC059506]|uniref:hypothetical protein n=1 Tax=Streptomyces sp. NPDC059506 TaxID=3347751 RepID=UPI003684DC3A